MMRVLAADIGGTKTALCLYTGEARDALLEQFGSAPAVERTRA